MSLQEVRTKGGSDVHEEGKQSEGHNKPEEPEEVVAVVPRVADPVGRGFLAHQVSHLSHGALLHKVLRETQTVE